MHTIGATLHHDGICIFIERLNQSGRSITAPSRTATPADAANTGRGLTPAIWRFRPRPRLFLFLHLIRTKRSMWSRPICSTSIGRRGPVSISSSSAPLRRIRRSLASQSMPQSRTRCAARPEPIAAGFPRYVPGMVTPSTFMSKSLVRRAVRNASRNVRRSQAMAAVTSSTSGSRNRPCIRRRPNRNQRRLWPGLPPHVSRSSKRRDCRRSQVKVASGCHRCRARRASVRDLSRRRADGTRRAARPPRVGSKPGLRIGCGPSLMKTVAKKLRLTLRAFRKVC